MSGFVQHVRETRRPIELTREDRSVAVRVDAERYAEFQDRLELLENICSAQAQLEKGEGIPHDEACAMLMKRLGK